MNSTPLWAIRQPRLQKRRRSCFRLMLRCLRCIHPTSRSHAWLSICRSCRTLPWTPRAGSSSPIPARTGSSRRSARPDPCSGLICTSCPAPGPEPSVPISGRVWCRRGTCSFRVSASAGCGSRGSRSPRRCARHGFSPAPAANPPESIWLTPPPITLRRGGCPRTPTIRSRRLMPTPGLCRPWWGVAGGLDGRAGSVGITV